MDAPVPAALCEALRRANARGCQLLSICSGVFVLAASGLLNGRKATTHWRYIEALKARYPAIGVVEDVLYQDEGDILTSAGSAAGIDLCLHVVRRDYGMETANSVARRLVIPPHRDGSQPQQLSRPVAQLRESQRLGQLFDFLHNHLSVSHSVDSLARRVGMSQRTFLRRFQAATGTTPARWLLNERLLRAKIIWRAAVSASTALLNKPDLDRQRPCVTISANSSRFPLPSTVNSLPARHADGRFAGKNRHNLAVNACMDRFVFSCLRPDTPCRAADQ